LVAFFLRPAAFFLDDFLTAFFFFFDDFFFFFFAGFLDFFLALAMVFPFWVVTKEPGRDRPDYPTAGPDCSDPTD